MIGPCVYLMRREDCLWKFGLSLCPEQRSRNLQSEFGQIFLIDTVYHHPHARRIEAIVHRSLAKFKTKIPGCYETYAAERQRIIFVLQATILTFKHWIRPPKYNIPPRKELLALEIDKVFIAYRKKETISQSNLADEIGISTSMVFCIEHGLMPSKMIWTKIVDWMMS